MVLSKFAAITSLADVDAKFPTEKDMILELMNMELLVKQKSCKKCGNEMTLRSRKDSYEWRCRANRNSDCSSASVKSGSWFQNSNLPLKTAFKMILCFVNKYKGTQISNELQVSENTVTDWRNMLRELCTRTVENYPPIGGNGSIIEIDETHVHTRKYGRGIQRGSDVWIIGGAMRGTRIVFAEVVQSRNAKTLVPLLKRNIKADSVVISDGWGAYSQLNVHFERHVTVNHSREFGYVMEDGLNVNTNTIEGVWRRLKDPLKAGNGTTDELLPSYINEFIVRERSGNQFMEVLLGAIIKMNAKISS
ncbi:hypothetical protein CRE_06611 [Caenorhabditis remanei]|uniref:Uncharacterized protein n=1 Tax=Caenorhabditis remanei TaxID=31234 RepID=E3M1S4_CAERE|nr:hypothetical protein CRE_06611 [Caenorhabditis remanei]